LFYYAKNPAFVNEVINSLTVVITSSNVAVASRGVTATPGVIVPGSPAGITKFKIAADSVPTLVTLASVPGAPVVVVPVKLVP